MYERPLVCKPPIHGSWCPRAIKCVLNKHATTCRRYSLEISVVRLPFFIYFFFVRSRRKNAFAELSPWSSVESGRKLNVRLKITKKKKTKTKQTRSISRAVMISYKFVSNFRTRLSDRTDHERRLRVTACSIFIGRKSARESPFGITM